ncbi:MAG: hypothetical protein Q9227_005189 [Pyrenula ochraceoflavens]
MGTGVAAHANSDMFKSPSYLSKSAAKRWDHILTGESHARAGSSLKGIAVHLKQPGMISLGGGLPSSEYFPFENLSMKVPKPPYFSEADTRHSGEDYTIGKHDVASGKSIFDLHIALNYGQSTGAAQLLRFVTEHTELVHNPPYRDWQCALTAGSTSALDMAFRMFCQRGDALLTEEYTFSTAVETARPLGIHVKGIAMDAEGLLPEHLDAMLSNWNPSLNNGARQPFILYTVPSGQNPTGATQSFERRKAILAVAEKHDLFILEDEPYYFLQMDPYPPSSSPQTTSSTTVSEPSDAFLKKLIPSYLSMSESGRVLRLDSFSKILAPGTRTGWITGPAQIVERYLHHAEVSVQNPSGISQVVVYKLLDEAWGHEGFLEWLKFIRAEYTARRNTMLQACEKFLPGEICSWVVPSAGMFHWIRVNISQHRLYQASSKNENARIREVEDAVFDAAVKKGVLVAKGRFFLAESDEQVKPTNEVNGVVNGHGTQNVSGKDQPHCFFRMTFAACPATDMEEAVRRFGEAVKEEFSTND